MLSVALSRANPKEVAFLTNLLFLPAPFPLGRNSGCQST
nr:MAG TPA: hypothetical protein [Caudoviricetes sp.]